MAVVHAGIQACTMTSNDQGTTPGSNEPGPRHADDRSGPAGPTDSSGPTQTTGWSDRGFDPRTAGSTFTHPEGLRRSRSDRKIAGVCGGLGRQLGIDPTVLRVAMVVLTIVGGLGIPLYVILALVMPNEGSDSTAVTNAIGPHLPEQVRSGPGLAILIGGVVLVASFIVSGIGNDHFWWGGWPPFPLLVIGGLIAWIVVRRRQRANAGTAGSAGATPSGFRPAATHRVNVPADPNDPGAPGPEFWSRPDPLGLYDDAAASFVPEATPAPTRTRIKRAPIGLILGTIALAGLSLAGLVVAAAAGAPVPPLLFPTIPALVVGVGLLIASRLGGSRLLVVAAIFLGLLSVGATRADLPSDIGAITTYTPATLVEAKAIGTVEDGRNVVDLRDVDFAKASSTLDLTLGSGVLTVIVPEKLDTDVSVDVNRGGWDLFGTKTGGQFDPDQPQPVTVSDDGTDGANAGGPHLKLDIDVTRGGFVQVERKAA